MQKERYQSQINQNFGTVCHTEVCLTFWRLAAKLSELAKKIPGRSLKIQPLTFFDINGLKNGPTKHFESSLKQWICSKDWWELWIAGRDHKKPNVLSSEEWDSDIFHLSWLLFCTFYRTLGSSLSPMLSGLQFRLTNIWI